MTYSIKYLPLFRVNILHQYFLNKGVTEFFTMNTADKEKQLVGYRVSDFFAVLPSAKCIQKLNGHGLIFKTTSAGFDVWVKVSDADNSVPFISLNNALELTFLLKITNHTFFNFTEIGIENADKLFFFSNKRITTGTGNFPLIKKAGSNKSVGEKYVLPEESASMEKRALSQTEQANLFGIVRLHMRGQNNGLSITTTQGKIRSPLSEFEIAFENRKTFWRYIFNENQNVVGQDDVKKENGNSKQLVTKQKQPLTSKGFVSLEHAGVELPNPNAKLVKPSNTSNKIFSEIYM